jgi:Tfp pilus assembly protein PilV
MTLSVAIALNAVAMLALIGVLSYLMTRASRLKPHLAWVEVHAAGRVRSRRSAPVRRARPASPVLASVRS